MPSGDIKVGNTFTIKLPKDISPESVTCNVESDFVIITEHKFERAFDKFMTRFKWSVDWKWWLGGGGSFIVSLVTASFNDKWGVSGKVFEILFQCGAILCLIVGSACLLRRLCLIKSGLSAESFWQYLKTFGQK